MNPKVKKILLWLLDLGINIAIIFILVVVIQKWLIAPFNVSGASMCDTLNNLEGECVNSYGERIIINEAVYLFNEPTRGDIVVFTTENSNEKYFIKRVIGLPGDIVEIKDGEVYLTKTGSTETVLLEENYLNESNKGNTKTYFSDFTVFEVPQDHYFLLGDNRNSSTDSRSCFQTAINSSCKENPEQAFVPRELIRGKAWIVWWPISSVRHIKTPIYEIDIEEDQASSESLEEK